MTGKDTEAGQALVLVVEDEPAAAEAIKKLLVRRLGVEVDIAQDLEAAREMVSSSDYLLITLDQKLPDGTGLEFLRELKAARNSTPVVMVSAVDPSSLKEDPVEIGAIDYVIKDEWISSRLIQAARLGLGYASE